MADRTVRVRIVAEAPGLAATMRTAAGSTVALGDAALLAGRGVRTLGLDALAARGGLTGLATGARGGAVALTETEAAARASGRGLRTAGAEAEASRGAFGRIGSTASSVMSSMKGLGLMLAGGAIIYGLHDIVHMGNEYNDSMNKFLEVTRASGGQMAAAGREAQALGADMKLPSASAAEAADAMVELAKAGLSAQDAIKAARGTIQLAAAARTDIATAAKIEGDIMDQFALKATDATKVADTLANTANSASGELMDIYYAMKYVGPIAHSVGVSIQDTATAIGLLGKSGIIGETAGTGLRSMLVNLAKPTKQAQEGLKELGIQAYDENGNFKGLDYVVTQLGIAHEKLSNKTFLAATAMAFGKPALASAVALAERGGPAFEQFAQQVDRSGGAAALAAAESKGLGGAMRGLAKEISSAFLQIYLAVSPGLEKVTRGMTSAVSDAIPYIKGGIRIATDLWDIYGPAVEKKLEGAGAGVGRAAASLVKPAEAALAGLAVTTIPLAVTGVQALGQTFHNAEAAVGPMVVGLKDMFGSVTNGAGALGVFAGRLQVGVGLLGDMSGVLRPLGSLVGGLAQAFGALPGPMQLSVISMLALRPFRPMIQGMQQSVVGFGRSGINAFRGIGDASLYQRVQAANAGQELGRFGGYVAELERRSPAIAAMGTAFRGVYQTLPATATAMERVSNTMGGLRAAAAVGALNGLKAAGRGVLGLFGGPWGLAITGAFAVLDVFSQHQQAAKQAVNDFTGAIQKDSGVLGDNSRQLAAQKLQQAGVLDIARKYGIELGTVERAALGQQQAVDEVNTALDKNASHLGYSSKAAQEANRTTTFYNADAVKLKQTLGDTSGVVTKAAQAYKNQADATKGAAGAAADATNPTGRLEEAIKTLANTESDADTKSRALHTALDLLSGGELDVEAAVANQNQALLDLSSTYKDGVDKANGYGKGLLQVDGTLNTTSQNGQTLWTKLQGLNEQTAGAAQASYDYARANDTAVVPALKQAEARMQTSWEAAVKAAEGYGMTRDQAELLAAQMGFIPSSLAITLSTPGLDDTEKGLLFVQGIAGHLPKGSTIKVAALTDDAVKDLESVGIKVKTLPGGRQMEITVPTDKATASLDRLIAKKIPGKTVQTSADTQATMDALQAVKDKLAGVPRGKSITISAPPASAIAALQSIGFKVTTLPNHQVSVTVPTGGAWNSTHAIQGYIDSVHGKSVTITTYSQFVNVGPQPGKGTVLAPGYADGGIAHAAEGLFVPGYAPRRDVVPSILAPGEGVLVPETVRKLGMMTGRGPAGVIKALNMWGRYGSAMRFADGGVVGHVSGVQRFAQGGFTYAPTATPVLGGGVTDALTRYNDALKTLQDAWKSFDSAMVTHSKAYQAVRDAERHLNDVRSHKHTYAQLQAAEDQLTKARRADADATNKANAAYRTATSADAAFGERRGARAPSGFDLRAYEKQLTDSVKATNAWRSNLDAVGRRGGDDVRAILEGMGQDGAALTAALAKASKKDFDTIVNNLKVVQGTASATLQDFDNQVEKSNRQNATFASDLQALASRGYGDLAKQLQSQGDQAAMDLAHKAATASDAQLKDLNGDVTTSTNILSGQDLADALVVLTTLRGGTSRGFSALLGAGLTMPTLTALIPRMLDKINQLPVSYKTEFLKEWAGQQGVTAMAQGGILRQPTVLAGEAGPEAYIPINASARSRDLLGQTASLFGYRLVPARQFGPIAVAHPAGPTHLDQSRTIHLHGTHQSLAEQRHDLLRQMTALG